MIEQVLNFSVFVSVVFGGFGFPENVKQNSLLLSPRPVGWLGMLPRGIVCVFSPSSHIVLLEVRSSLLNEATLLNQTLDFRHILSGASKLSFY